MNIAKRIKLDFGRSTSPVVVWAKQGDIGSRSIEVEPMLNGMVYTLPSGIGAEFACKRPDGVKISYELPSVSNNLISVPLTSNALKVPGECLATVVLKEEVGQSVLSAQNFLLQIEENPFFNTDSEIPDDNPDFDPDYSDIPTYTGEVEVV